MTKRNQPKRWSRRTLDRMETKANKEYNLNDCPKCGEGMSSNLEHYEDSDMVVTFYCEECNISKTHSFKWFGTEVQHYNTRSWDVESKEIDEAHNSSPHCNGCRIKINPFTGEAQTSYCHEAIRNRTCPHVDFRERF